MTNKEKFIELVSDEQFMQSVLELNTIEEVKEAFTSKGIEISAEELETVKTAVEKALNEEVSLSEEELELVCAGVGEYSFKPIYLFYLFITGIIAGVAKAAVDHTIIGIKKLVAKIKASQAAA